MNTPGTPTSSGPISPRSQKWSHSTMDRPAQVAMTGWDAWPLLPL